MLNRIFPFLSWFERYDSAALRADLLAGLTVALVLIPQSMAYAQLAGLPVYYGLYAAFLPPLVAALFGSSPQLATGPVAVVSMMTAAALDPLATAGSESYVAYAICLALIVGGFQFLLGILKLGVVVDFLSHPVVIGFTNAAAIIIATSQLPALLGVSVEKSDHHYETVYRTIVAASNHLHWPTLALGLFALAVMAGLKARYPRFPCVVVAVVASVLISWAIGFENNHTVAVANLHAPEIEPLLDKYNSARDAMRQASEVRAHLNPLIASAGGGDGGTCTSCHAHREVSLTLVDAGRATNKEETVSTGKVLQLHARAGLLNQYLDELRALASNTRESIRRMPFEAVREQDGSTHFYPQGHLPNGARSEGSRWYIKVSNRNFDKEKITLSGGGTVVGAIPLGLPSIQTPKLNVPIFFSLLTNAVIISLLGFMEAISIAKAMAARTGRQLDPSQELIGQGLANIAGAFTQSYAVSGSFSRSAVNIQAGAVSGLSSVFAGVVVAVALLYLTPLLYHLPQSVLAAIIMMAVAGLINVKGIVHAWHAQRRDGIIAIISFITTLAFAPHMDKGIIAGVGLSVLLFLGRAMRPKIAELSLYKDGAFRDAVRFRLSQCRRIAIIRFDGPLFFASTGYLEEEIRERIAALPELKQIIIMANGISELDASGEEMLSLLVDRLRAAGYRIAFSGFNEQVLDVLHRTHLYEKIGGENIYPLLSAAIDALHAAAHEGMVETDCPLKKVVQMEMLGRAFSRR